ANAIGGRGDRPGRDRRFSLEQCRALALHVDDEQSLGQRGRRASTREVALRQMKRTGGGCLIDRCCHGAHSAISDGRAVTSYWGLRGFCGRERSGPARGRPVLILIKWTTTSADNKAGSNSHNDTAGSSRIRNRAGNTGDASNSGDAGSSRSGGTRNNRPFRPAKPDCQGRLVAGAERHGRGQ